MKAKPELELQTLRRRVKQLEQQQWNATQKKNELLPTPSLYGRNEQATSEVEAQFRLLADAVPQILWVTDAAGRTEFFNRQWSDYTGVAFEPGTAAQVAGQFIHPEDAPATMNAFNAARNSGSTFVVEHRIRSHAGDYRWFLVRAEPYRDPVSGQIARWFGSSTDIHERKRTEAALGESESKYRALFESMEQGFCILQVIFDDGQNVSDYRHVEVNPKFEQQTGLQNAGGKTAHELAPNLERFWFDTYGAVALTGEPTRFVHYAGPLGRWFEVSAFRIGMANEHRVAVLFSDVTARRNAEEELRKAKERLEAAAEAAELGIWTWDVQADSLVADRNTASFFGLDEGAAAEGRTANTYIQQVHAEDQGVMRRALAAVLAKGGSYNLEYRVTDSAKSVRWLASRGRMKLDDAGRPQSLNGVVLDITERKHLEEALAISQGRLQQVFQQAPVAILMLRGRDYVVELANPQYQALLGGRELVGRRFAEIVPELGQDVWNVFERVLDTGEPYVASDWHIPYDSDQDGVSEEHWFNSVYQPFREPDGTVSGFIAVVTEVTRQVLARQELERVNRELEEFAYVASHDLQEPLRMIRSYSQLLVRRLGDGLNDDGRTYVGFIENGVKRMQQLIQDLLSYSRVVHTTEELTGSEVSLDEALGKALIAVETRRMETGGTIEFGRLPTLRGDLTQLSQVFQNLLSNALKYRKPQEPPVVQIGAREQGGQWVISVRDNGIGFDPAQAERIFGLFKRLHRNEEYPGTGLGLAICKRTVERYGGKMWASSEPGVGSNFFFSLPKIS